MKTRTIAALTTLCLALVAAWTFAPEREIITETRIDASPDAVWDVLTDGAAYLDWNPFIREMQGKIAVGATLTNTIQPTGGDAMTFKPTVLVAKEAQELRWLGRFILPGVFDGEHYFTLVADGAGTRFIHGERFSGIALWFMDVEQFTGNFEAMNEALAAEVIARQGG